MTENLAGSSLHHSQRQYSSKKIKKKHDAKKSGHYKHSPKMALSPEEYEDVLDLDKMTNQMEAVVNDLKQEFIKNLSLRTALGSFNSLVVNTSDGKYPLNQLGQVVQKSPQLIVINLASLPQYVPEVKTAIEQSGMNINPQQDGSTLFIPIPKVTMEHRERLAKAAKNLCHKSKDRLKDIQNRYTKDVKKSKVDHSEDLLRSINELILSTTHKYSLDMDALTEAKQQELLVSKH